jgi:hypothetical protein
LRGGETFPSPRTEIGLPSAVNMEDWHMDKSVDPNEENFNVVTCEITTKIDANFTHTHKHTLQILLNSFEQATS